MTFAWPKGNPVIPICIFLTGFACTLMFDYRLRRDAESNDCKEPGRRGRSMKYEEVLAYIRQHNHPNQYDFNGVVHLLLAALDNLHVHAREDELEFIGHSMTEEQRFFLKKIADIACRVTDKEIETDE
ncbi:MAG: hypothetical protein ACREEM_29430 [Blastocatellia bacterium]